MKQASIVDQSIWDQGYQDYTLAPSQNLRENAFLEQFLPCRKGTAIEIGCFPGRYMPLVGSKGYTLSGIDLTPRLSELPPWLESLGCQVDEFYNEDFCTWQTDKQYDAVISCGFIEHFTNWHDLFIKHCSLVAPSGMLLMMFPNFYGVIQKYLHRWLDAQNLALHWQEAMQINQYKDICASQGFDILFSGYWGGFDFWLGNNVCLSGGKLFFFKMICRLCRRTANIPSRKWYAPYCGIVAKRI